MASSEPTLVPEWLLRCNGHGSGGSSVAHHYASANSHSDAPLLANLARSKSSKTNTDTKSPRAALDRSSYTNSKRNSINNGSSKNPYSNFSRSHRDKDREKEPERSAVEDFWKRDSFEPLGKDPLRRIRLMMSRKQGDSFPHSDAKNFRKFDNKDFQKNGMAIGDDKPSSSVTSSSFDKDFPSLGADEKQVPNIVRVASPGSTIAPHGLPIGNSALFGEGWSALAEVPVVKTHSINQSLGTSVASLASSTTSGALNVMSESLDIACDSNPAGGAPAASGPFSGLNMAEALIQPPPATCTDPQLSVETQRLEQLVLKKVKKLIPMTPATPKALNSSDKLKSKSNARFGEISGANKVGMHQSPSTVSDVGHLSRGGAVISDASKQFPGTKLYVLKPQWENDASVISKDGSSPEKTAGGRQINSIVPGPAASSSIAKSPNSSKAAVMERRTGSSSLTMASSIEKRPLSSFAKSRSDFFNAVRKKTSITTTVASEDKSEIASESHSGTENGGLILNNDLSDEDRKLLTGENNLISCPEVIPDEEEVAFLRSLGWKEDCDEEGLTSEEINAFYQGVMKLMPSLNLSEEGQPALSLLMESNARKVGVASPRVSSSDAAALKSN